MAFQSPNLDNRNFQDIVDELKQRIPLYNKEWTDHNVSDPGVTLIELFAYMMEQLLYRLNQVPLLYYATFAQFLGIEIPTPQPARVGVTFWLSRPQTLRVDPDDSGKLIEEGTEVSTTQTETTDPVIFTTEADAKISAPVLSAIIVHNRGSSPTRPSLERLAARELMVALFSSLPQREDMVYFEFDNDLSHHILALPVDFETKAAINIDVTSPPIRWEAYTARHKWEPIEDVKDTTKGFNTAGRIVLHLPALTKYIRPAEESIGGADQARYSIRIVVTRQEYQETPRLLHLEQTEIAALGRTVEAVHTQIVQRDFLGISDGSPGQRFQLSHGPIVLPLGKGENLWVGPLPEGDLRLPEERPEDQEPGDAHQPIWKYVENFGDLDPERSANQQHFTIDVTTNEVRLGPAIRMPSGEIRSFGAVPGKNAPIYFTRYRYGGSVANVPRAAINVLKSSIPYVAYVENRRPASGGQDAPSLDALELEVQRYLRKHRLGNEQGAVTGDDYRALVLDKFPEQVARVDCRTVEAGSENGSSGSHGNGSSDHANTLFVFITAPLTRIELNSTNLNAAALQVEESVVEQIEEYLYEFRMLTTRVRVENPAYVRINVRINLAGAAREEIQARVLHHLANYFHPLTGGPGGDGWPLGSLIRAATLRAWLQNRLRDAEIHRLQIQQDPLPTADASSPNTEAWVSELQMAWNQLVIPGSFQIEFQ